MANSNKTTRQPSARTENDNLVFMHLDSLYRRVRRNNHFKTISMRDMHQCVRKDDVLPLSRAEERMRPKKRSECEHGLRPCPWVACRHHLYLDVTYGDGIRLPADMEPGEMAETCSLDVAERGGLDNERIGKLLNVCRERIRQIEDVAMRKLNKALRMLKTEFT